jgi:hypothetical protein
MNWKIVLGLAIVLYVCFFNKSVENFWSRPNKCFDCEKQITSSADAHLAFPTKCFSCEKQQGQIPYHTGPTKCFDCETKEKSQCKAKLTDVGNYFTTFGRNMQMPGRF